METATFQGERTGSLPPHLLVRPQAFATPQPLERIQEMIYVVLPAYNEAPNIGPLLERVSTTMSRAGWQRYTIVAVDDGSTDDTRAALDALSEHLPLDVQSNERNRGLAETLKRGLMRAVTLSERDDDIIVTMDADNSHGPGLIGRMIASIREGNDIVIASRYRYGANVRGLAMHRRLLSVAASTLFQLTFPIPGVRDFTCGYRAYRSGLLKRAFQDLGADRIVSERGFSCMVDILLKIREYDPIITEVPLILRYDNKVGRSKMQLARTIGDTLKLIARRRLGVDA